MAQERGCSKCKTECSSNETIVVCEGFCVGIQRYHARCVGLSDDEGGVCLHRNILWMCDNCLDLMENIRFRETVNAARSVNHSVEKEVENLKADFVKMNETINNLLDKVALISSDDSSTKSTFRPPSVDNSPPLSSTKIISTPGCSNATTVKLHISNIANDVTTDEVLQMVYDSIGVKEIFDIKCLKPAWRNVDFISFKVEIPGCHRTNALNLSKWPKGIRCREFKDFVDTTWRPVR